MKIISISQIKALLTCSEYFRLRYVDKVPEPTKGSSLILGSAVHGTIEEFFRQRVNDKIIDVEEYFHNMYDRLINETEQEGKEVEYGEWTNYEDEVTRGKEMLIKYLSREDIYHISEIYNEVPFVCPIPGFDDVVLYGIIDAIIPTPNGIVIADYKTTKAKVEHWFINNDIQLLSYAYALKHGKPVKGYDLAPNTELEFLFGEYPIEDKYVALFSAYSKRKPWQVWKLDHFVQFEHGWEEELVRTLRNAVLQMKWHEENNIWIKNLKDPTTTPCNSCAYRTICWANKKMSFDENVKKTTTDGHIKEQEDKPNNAMNILRKRISNNE